MALISGNNINLAFGGSPIFDQLNFQIDRNERLCIVGRNGAGKSSFLKLLNKELHCDEGDIHFQKNLKVSLMDQYVPEALDKSCYQVIASGLESEVDSLTDYYQILSKLETNPENTDLFEQLDKVQRSIDEGNLWDVDHQIQKVASLLSIDLNEAFASLSGGRKRRVWLARALVSEPDVLLLDEPTNHIDLETVLWLENFLLSWQGSLVFISHDRSFISKLATRIIDIDRGKASSWPGDFQNYLVRKQEFFETEEKQNKLFDKKLAQEEVWIRQGIKARRTRNEGRVRELKSLRDQRKARIDKQGVSKFDISLAEQSSKVVIEAKNLGFSFDGKHTILKDFSTLIMRGDKIGIIGPNGIGKSTLVNILLGKIACQQGELKVADNLEISYFDQLRESLDENKNIIDNVAEGSDFLEIGEKKIHVISYLKDFLFPPERLRTPLNALSGGERNRVLMAKLFSKPCNFLVLDEPTNDLDIETLELLEERLLNFTGTLLLISHDRSFLNNIVTSTLAFEKTGVHEYIGGYDDWLNQRPDSEVLSEVDVDNAIAQTQTSKDSQNNREAGLQREGENKPKARKLSYKEQQELESLPRQIEKLEADIRQIHHQLSDPGNYQGDNTLDIASLNQSLQEAEHSLEHAFLRWAELEG